MDKGERISQFVAELSGDDVNLDLTDVANHSFTARFSIAGTHNVITKLMTFSSSFG